MRERNKCFMRRHTKTMKYSSKQNNWIKTYPICDITIFAALKIASFQRFVRVWRCVTHSGRFGIAVANTAELCLWRISSLWNWYFGFSEFFSLLSGFKGLFWLFWILLNGRINGGMYVCVCVKQPALCWWRLSFIFWMYACVFVRLFGFTSG